MNIHALVVCVDYADLLARSISEWRSGLSSLTVVTSARDEATKSLAVANDCRHYETEVFWDRGALFNKGAAIQAARSLLPEDGWHLFLDADVVPPSDWAEIVRKRATDPLRLYGARRVYEDGRPVGDGELAGFFQMFYHAEPRSRAPLDTEWKHAGCYDSQFMRRWPRESQTILPLVLRHIGETGKNWCGRGRDDAMATLMLERRARGGWRHETVTGG